MRTVTCQIFVDRHIEWLYFPDAEWHKEEGLCIDVPFYRKLSRRDTLKTFQDTLIFNKVDWLYCKDAIWYANLDKLKEEVKTFQDLEWFKGTICLEPEVEIIQQKVFNKLEDRTHLKFIASKEEIILSYPKRIFLSHKGVDKPFVREYKSILEILGFSPWLDEEAMVAGVELERGLLQGFKDSCAAIFFITPSFKDVDYLSSEINYAIAEKREKRERFSIITLVFSDSDNAKGVVPELLKQFVWKEPKTDLEALHEILRALPVQVGSITWKN
jgi:hypothetical protein